MQEIMQANAEMEDNGTKRKIDEVGSAAEVDNASEDDTAMLEDAVDEGGDGKNVFDSFLKVTIGGVSTPLLNNPGA